MPDHCLVPSPHQPLSAPPQPFHPEPEPEAPAVPLSHYLWVLRRHRWKILAFVLASLAGTFIVSSRLTPIFESTATVDIDRRIPTGVLGQEALQSPINDSDQFLATQIRLVQSDSVLRPVVRRFKLPVEDAAPARSGDLPAAQAEDAPVRLRHLNVARPINTYLLLISFRSPDPVLAAQVANAIANSYIEHTYQIRFRSSASLSSFMERQLEELRAKMERSSAALAQFERELNVINPEEKTTILSARLLQLNTEYTQAQADRVSKEAAFNSVKGGVLEAAQVSSQGEALKKLLERRDEAQEAFARVKTHYGPNHPEYRKAATQLSQVQVQVDSTRLSISRRVEIEYQQAVNRERMLQKAFEVVKAESDRLNARSFEYQNLKREAEADKRLYAELVQKIREAGINAGFQTSAIRLADQARPALKPVFPNFKLNLALAFLCSSLLAVGAALLSDALDATVRDPEQVRRTLGTEVIGNLPLVKPWRGHLALPAPSAPGAHALACNGALQPAGRHASATDSFSESIRTLRNSILLGSSNGPLHSLLITSATPSEGKTTTAVHLALAHAQQKIRTLLIDADLRRPGVHRLLRLPEDVGLSSVLADGHDWRTCLLALDGVPDLAILTAGKPTRRAADLIGSGLPALVAEAAREYDLVVVDSPPLLGFPEPLQIAAVVDGVVLITVAGRTPRKAIAGALNTLARVRARTLGLVLNAVTNDLSDYSYYGYYGKYYKYYGHPHSSSRSLV